MRATVTAAAVVMALGAPALAQQPKSPDAEAGQLAFNNACRTCHTLKEGDNRLGPHLHGVIGRKAGSLPDYAYSGSMKQAGIAWDEATLDRFLADPDSVVRDTKMKPFGGIASADERRKIIAFLKSNGD